MKSIVSAFDYYDPLYKLLGFDHAPEYLKNYGIGVDINEEEMMLNYYARSYEEKEFDDRIRETVKSTQDPYKMAMYVQGQAQLNLLRRIDDKLKGYPIQDGYMGWIDQDKRYRLFATEADYREFMEERSDKDA